MSNDIKVGDVCVFEPPKRIGPTTIKYGGMECTVLAIAVATMLFGPMHHVQFSDGNEARVAAMFLRKKRPPADPSQWIRQQTVPRERFEQWREQLRHGAKIGESVDV